MIENMSERMVFGESRTFSITTCSHPRYLPTAEGGSMSILGEINYHPFATF